MAPTVYTPPTPTYTPIATITLDSTGSEIVFSSIPAGYRDLIVQGQTRSTRADNTEDLYLKLNSDAGTNYSTVFMYGTSGGIGSYTQTTSGLIIAGNTSAANQTAGKYSSVYASVMDYSASDKHTTVLARNGGGSQDQVWAGAHRWANTGVVTSLTLYYKIGQIAAGTTFSIYGIAS